MLTDLQREQWDRDGFFLIRGFADPAICQRMSDVAIDEIRANAPSGDVAAGSF